MPVLDRKGSRRSKPVEKTLPPPPEVSSRVWKIISRADNMHKIHQIKQRILATRQWAFAWCRRPNNWYYLIGSIVFQIPHTENWLRVNLGNSVYHLPDENPNSFRNHQIESVEEEQRSGDEALILIDDGPFH
jgi:hypothetical protein